MKKLLLTLGTIFIFNIASAQSDTTKSKVDSKKTQIVRDIRTDAQKKQAAQKNINDLEQNTNAITPSMQVQPALNPNSSAMPQYTPPVSPPPPAATTSGTLQINPTTPVNPTSPTPRQ